MSKLTIANEIKLKLELLGISKNGCHNLDIKLGDGNKINWVSPTQVCISKNTSLSNVYRNKRYALYSKDVSLEMLNLINNAIPYKK
jgi:hypothetical protein